MFIWDFVVSDIFEQILNWIYDQVLQSINSFFGMMNNMGADLFQLPWVQAVVLFFSYLAWILFVIGLVVAVFELAIEYQNGRADIRSLGLNTIKGFMAVSLFTTVPIALYKFAISLQLSLVGNIIGLDQSIEITATKMITLLTNAGVGVFLTLILSVVMGYAVVKVFFANLKRGGILFIQIAVGSFYMFSVPRGYQDGFMSWCKQILGLCLTAFLQTVLLCIGLMIVPMNMLLGVGVMLASGEIPRIADRFGMDTSTKASMTSAMYSMSSAINLGSTITRIVGGVK
ncbi:MAG: DUF6045 family protein [Anaerorhabdus sp.]|uniref:conjugal transfer protein TrbL family protein n=1 Tax=Anaerorhabdus sp. TaxID=1872524 RepID=UPI002FCB37A5